jgi:hypothetical protein
MKAHGGVEVLLCNKSRYICGEYEKNVFASGFLTGCTCFYRRKVHHLQKFARTS